MKDEESELPVEKLGVVSEAKRQTAAEGWRPGPTNDEVRMSGLQKTEGSGRGEGPARAVLGAGEQLEACDN